MKSKTIRRIGSVILAITMLLCVSLTSVVALGAQATDGTGRDLDKDVSLTLIKYQEDKNAADVSDQTPLAGIPFLLQLVELKTGKEQGSTDPDDYAVQSTINELTGTATNSTGLVKWENLDQGIYLVTELASTTVANPNVRFLVSLPMLSVDGDEWIYDVIAYPKNDVDSGPDIGKEENTAENNGNVITWQYNVGIPTDIANAKNLVITDALDSRLTYVTGSIKGWYVDKAGVKHNLTASHYTATYTNAPNKLVITITDPVGFTELANALAGEGSTLPMLHFSFDTSVSTLDDGNLDTIKNGGTLDYTNENGFVYDTNTIPESGKPEAELYGIHIYKINVNEKPLEGAEFKLYNGIDCANADLVSSDVYTTDEDGDAYIYGLVEGTYYLMETKAPEGYNAITTPILVVVSGTASDENHIVKITVTNSNDFTLPQTGGTGTMLFTIGGLVLIGVACALLFAAKKKKSKT